MRHMVRRVVVAAAIACAMTCAPARAADVSSAYTGLDLDKDCKLLTLSNEGSGLAEWRCKGYGGMEVRLVESDLRFHVSYGGNAGNQIAAGQTLPRFNRPHKTLEWRLMKQGGRPVPFATILRFFAEADGEKAQYLVVTKLAGEEACWVGIVPVAGNKQANETARQLADSLARSGKCPQDVVPHYGPGLTVIEAR
ncbi:MAG: hypothetical protein VX871_04235 [Pseudomonadota bacterium]|nr:hypothetical protein [Pseudomonadota bacterium]